MKISKKEIKRIMTKVGMIKKLREQSAYTSKEVEAMLVRGLQIVSNLCIAQFEKDLKKKMVNKQ